MAGMGRLGLLVVIILLAGCADPRDGGLVVGTLEREPVALTAERAEPIVAIHAREGERVAAGDIVVELDPARPLAERARLVAQRDRAQARLDEVMRGPRRELVLEARARLAAADAARHEAELERARVRELFRADLASARERDAADSALEQASAARDAARAEVDRLLEGATAEELLQAQAELADLEAALKLQDITVARLALRAPRDARVESLPFVVGETPPAGAVVARLQSLDRSPYARVFVPASLHARLAPGTRVRVTVDGRGEFDGTVRYLSPEAAYTPYFALTEHDADRLSYLAEIDLAGADDLPGGIPVRVVAPE